MGGSDWKVTQYMSHQGVTFEEKFKTRFFVIVAVIPTRYVKCSADSTGFGTTGGQLVEYRVFKCEKVRATSALRNRKIQKVLDTLELWACDLDHNYNATMVRKA